MGMQKMPDELKRDQPIGIEIGEINFQHNAVVKATNSFNLGKEVTIVFVVLLFAMGRKAGLIIKFARF